MGIVDFLFPFRSPLENLVREISPNRHDRAKADLALINAGKMVRQWEAEGYLPRAKEKKLLLTGGRSRETDIKPLTHIDTYYLIQGGGGVFIPRTGNLQFVHQNDSLFALADQGHNISASRVINTCLKNLVKTNSVKHLSNGMGWQIKEPETKLLIKIYPAILQSSTTFLIPLGYGETGWQKIHPEQHSIFFQHLDKTHNQLVKPTIRLAKLWNEQHNHMEINSYHLEASIYHIFKKHTAKPKSLAEAFTIFLDKLPAYLTDCPDPLKISSSLDRTYSQNIDRWYICMNRIATARQFLQQGEKEMVNFLKKNQ